MSVKIKELPELERPYEKLELKGEKALSNAELLAIIIKTGTKEETSVGIAQRILSLNDTKKEDLEYLVNVSLEELMKIKGIGRVKAIQIKAACELGIRIFQTSNKEKKKIEKPHDIARLFMNELRFEKKEKFIVVCLSTKGDILKVKEVAIGGSNYVNRDMKDIIAEVLKVDAPRFILVHNHPSGDSTPSELDMEYTNLLYEMAELIGLELVDHLVIGNYNYTSIHELIVKEEEKRKAEEKKLKEERKRMIIKKMKEKNLKGKNNEFNKFF